MKPPLACAFLLCSLFLAASEDPRLRQQANEMTDRSVAVTSAPTWPPHRQEIRFRYTDANDVTTEGLATLDYQAP